MQPRDKSSERFDTVIENWGRITVLEQIGFCFWALWMSSRRAQLIIILLILSITALIVAISSRSWGWALLVGILVGWAISEMLNIFRR